MEPSLGWWQHSMPPAAVHDAQVTSITEVQYASLLVYGNVKGLDSQ